ncbi:MAG: TatD family hydrolase [Anaerovoracaceae bacterium]
MLFDSHAHLNNEKINNETRELLANGIANSDVSYMMDVGFNLASSKLAVDHSEKYSWCYAAVGCHPHDADQMDDMELMMYKSLAKKSKVKAIGEIGLDFHYDNSSRDAQREWFRKQIRLANELKMPIVIHSRDADQEVLDILKEEQAFSDERKSWFQKRSDGTGDARVLLHCFSGSAELATQYVKLGGTISIAGPVTYKNNKKTLRVVEEIPLDYLLIETDAPYLTPEPHRGKKNISPFVEFTAKKIAEIKGITFEEVANKTCENAKRFFDIE